jgi:DNA polymerase-3 subunit epsilon
MIIACLDFETANYSHTSACAVGLAIFDQKRSKGVPPLFSADSSPEPPSSEETRTPYDLMEAPYWLVKPPKGHGYFRDDFTDIHGLTWFDVQAAPEFTEIATEVLEHLSKADIVVAHNASFDMDVLKQTLTHFGLASPEFDYLCTLGLARRIWLELPNHQLNTVAAHISHEFNHHHAQSDAEAAGRVLLAMMQHADVNTPRELLLKAGMEPKRFCKKSSLETSPTSTRSFLILKS